MLRTSKGRGAGKRTRPSEVVSRQIDSSEIIAPAVIRQAEKLTRRFGLSAAVAARVAELAFAVPETWGSRA